VILVLLAASGLAEKTRKLNAESVIANVCLALMATISIFLQDEFTSSACVDWALYTDAPLRVFENELGVQAPCVYEYGFIVHDFTADGNVKNFQVANGHH